MSRPLVAAIIPPTTKPTCTRIGPVPRGGPSCPPGRRLAAGPPRPPLPPLPSFRGARHEAETRAPGDAPAGRSAETLPAAARLCVALDQGSPRRARGVPRLPLDAEERRRDRGRPI